MKQGSVVATLGIDLGADKNSQDADNFQVSGEYFCVYI